MRRFHIILLQLFALTSITVAQNHTENYNTTEVLTSIQQVNRILKDYDKKLRPNAGGPPVVVEVGLGILKIGPINEKKATLDIDLFFRQRWKDARLAFNGNRSITINDDPKNLFWVPDTAFPNAVESSKHSVTTINSRIIIQPDGTIFASQRISITFACHMNLRAFPMDKQHCKLEIESYSFPSDEIEYEWMKRSPVETVSHGMELEGYVVDELTTDKKNIHYPNNHQPETFIWLILGIKITRNFNYYLFHYYVPSILLVMMTWATFYIPSGAFPARVAIIVTTLLSCVFIVQGGVSQIVRTSYRTSLEIFFTFDIVFIVFSMVEYMLVVNIKPRSSKPHFKDRWRKLRLAICKRKEFTLEESIVGGEVHVNKAMTENFTFEKGSSGDEPIVKWKGGETRERKKKYEAKENTKLEEESKKLHSLNSNCHFVDAWARFIFPITYFIGVIIYFCYYLIWYEQ